MAEENVRPPQKQYDYLLKFLLVGDSDVGKQEILSDLDDGASESPFCSGSGKCTYLNSMVFFFSHTECSIKYKCTIVLSICYSFVLNIEK